MAEIEYLLDQMIRDEESVFGTGIRDLMVLDDLSLSMSSMVMERWTESRSMNSSTLLVHSSEVSYILDRVSDFTFFVQSV